MHVRFASKQFAPILLGVLAASALAPGSVRAQARRAAASPITVRHVTHAPAPRALIGVHGQVGLATAPHLEPSKVGLGVDLAYELSSALALQAAFDFGLDGPIAQYWRAAAGARLQWPEARVVVPYLALSVAVGSEATGWIDGPRWQWTPIVAVAPELGIEVRPTRALFVRASTRVDTIVSFGTPTCTGEAAQCAEARRPEPTDLFVGLGFGVRL